MCGLAGFTNFGLDKRSALIWSLGLGIDDRGGHAAGFVTLNSTAGPLIGRKAGYWQSAKERFLRRAIQGHTTMMHARFATCGRGGIDEAHPFEVTRNGRPVLWGAHNGMIWNAEESATSYGRSYDVDSRELFELLADGESLEALEGFGVITWIEADKPHHVNMAKLSSSDKIYVCRTTCGGIVWGSTPKIVRDALSSANLTEECNFTLDEVGRVYLLSKGGVFKTKRDGVKVGAGWTGYRDAWIKEEQDWMAEYLAAYERDDA